MEMEKKSIKQNRVMLAGMKSHSGKTTITCALLEVLRRRGLDPASFKCGPDYIDPMFHEKILGIESRNLDTYFAGRSGVRRAVAACTHRLAVIEGVMGLYDGADVKSTACSSYEIASAAETPIILIVDAAGAGRTILSWIKGMLADDTAHLIRGLILNRCSAGHYKSLQGVLESELTAAGFHVRLLGAVPACNEIRLESRHLGLIMPGEIEGIRDKIRSAADLLEENVNVEGILELMEEAGELSVSSEEPETVLSPAGKGLTLAVARDEAFCFYYKENLEMFERRGVTIRFFSPLHDRELPGDADAFLLGGGYPENHLRQLSRNRSMLESIRDAAERGMPSLAECGGFMYLHRAVSDIHGERFAMAGVIDGECFYTGHLVRFGYMQIEAVNSGGGATDSLAESLVGMRGHEFHYYDSTLSGDVFVAGKPFRHTKWNCIVTEHGGVWGFPHFYYGSNGKFLDAFVSRMREAADG